MHYIVKGKKLCMREKLGGIDWRNGVMWGCGEKWEVSLLKGSWRREIKVVEEKGSTWDWEVKSKCGTRKSHRIIQTLFQFPNVGSRHVHNEVGSLVGGLYTRVLAKRKKKKKKGEIISVTLIFLSSSTFEELGIGGKGNNAINLC